MSDSLRPTGRTLAARRPREVDVYGGTPETPDAARSNLFFIVWRRRWLVAACICIGLIAGATVNYRAIPIYSCGAVIYVQDNALRIINDPMGGGHSQGYLFTQCQLISSTAILSAALDKPDVMKATCLQGVDNPVGVLKASVSAMPDKVSDLITVSMDRSAPKTGA